MLKIKKIEKQGRVLNIYFKIPFYSNWKKTELKLRKYYDDDSSLNTWLDESGKYAVIVYLLRNKEDIIPYIKYGDKK